MPIFWDNLASSLALIKSGKFVPIGLAYPKRIPQLPNVPTFAELGLPEYEADTWFGLVGPAGVPPDVVKKFYEAAQTALKDPDTIKRFEDTGAFPIGSTPEQFTATIKKEVAKWKKVVEAKKISLEL